MKKRTYSLQNAQELIYTAMYEIEFAENKVKKKDRKELMGYVVEMQGFCSAMDRILILNEE